MKRRLAILAGIVALVLVCATGCGRGARSRQLVLAGSTSVQPVAENIAEHYQVEHPDRIVNVQGGGSTAGVKAATDGAADIGMASRSLKPEEASVLTATAIALDAVCFIVHPSNRLEAITKEQAQAIYLGKITRWSEMAGPEWSSLRRRHDRITVITREEGSGTRSAFEESVMDKQDICPQAIVQDSTGTVRAIVETDPNAIGYISLGMATEGIKVIAYEGVVATEAAVHDHTYPLSRPFNLLTKGEPSPDGRAFLDYALSPEGQRLVTQAGYIPVREGSGAP